MRIIKVSLYLKNRAKEVCERNKCWMQTSLAYFKIKQSSHLTPVLKTNDTIVSDLSVMVVFPNTRANGPAQIPMQRYEWLSYMQGQARGLSQKSPHFQVVFLLKVLLLSPPFLVFSAT